MKCIILVAGHATRLEEDIKQDERPEFEKLRGVPKALLPGPAGPTLLDNWWSSVGNASNVQFSEVFLVVNADKYKYYERWATASGFPRENIINDGTTAETGGIGAVADLMLVLRARSIDEEVFVVAGDMLFNPEAFDLGNVIKFFHLKEGQLAGCYQLKSAESTANRGIVEMDLQSNVVKRFLERPKEGETTSRLASIVFFCFRPNVFPLLSEFLDLHESKPQKPSFGSCVEWLVSKTRFYAVKLPSHFSMIGADVGLEEYRKHLLATTKPLARTQSIVQRAYARVGLVGNPSDGFFGKTIALSIRNYWAEVTITPSKRLRLIPHKLNDPDQFGSLSDLYTVSRREGYQGGMRLMQATCKRFYEYCSEHGIAISKQNFSLEYDTNIPRQVGLAGSSAIVTAVLQCLMRFYHLSEEDIPLPQQPSFVLSVESSELRINAGLQDRVVQAYEGCVFMNFAKEIMDTQGHGEYEYLDMAKLPGFWLAYLSDPSDSGKIHSNVRQRYDSGDQEVIEAMAQFGELTTQAAAAIENGDHLALADIMDANFSLRRKVYGDAALGEPNLEMIAIAHRHKSAVKFPGSGGAVVGLCRDPSLLPALRREMQAGGFVFVDIVPNAPGR
eukprot:m.259822 g.259822  ORF g.259822 m.259822 type:complete len:616 (+) comp19206_c0_seq14:186-2033(+)